MLTFALLLLERLFDYVFEFGHAHVQPMAELAAVWGYVIHFFLLFFFGNMKQ